MLTRRRYAERWTDTEVVTPHRFRFDQAALAKLLTVTKRHLLRMVPLPPLTSPKSPDPAGELAAALAGAEASALRLEAMASELPVAWSSKRHAVACRVALLEAAHSVAGLHEAMRQASPVPAKVFKTRARLEKRISKAAPGILSRSEGKKINPGVTLASLRSTFRPDPVRDPHPELGFGYDLSDFAWKCARCGGRFFALTGRRIYCSEKCASIGNGESRRIAARLANRKRRAGVRC